MEDKLKMAIRIEVPDNDRRYEIGNAIHEQLVGNQDYIDSNIVLNIEEPRTVKLYIFEECENIPKITIC